MDYARAVEWLMEMDSRYGPLFNLEDMLDEVKYEEDEQMIWKFYEFCEREGFDPHALAMSVMPSFAIAIMEHAR